MIVVNLLRTWFLMSLVKNMHSINDTRKLQSRKIVDGKPVGEAVRYMVYLTKAEKSATEYDAWICGGAIVTREFIVTSAACVEDVQFMYAISGYSKYVNVKNIATNQCTKASRKKIVFICVPKRYDFAYDKIQKWAFIDIAAVKVESPYDFSAPVLPGCSWTPNKIDINFEPKYQAPNLEAIILGWGHTKKWRSPNDAKDYNQEELQYSSIKTMEKEKCKEMYSKTPELIPIIDSYMICAMYDGNLNEKGEQKSKNTFVCRFRNGCRYPYAREKDISDISGYHQMPSAIRPTIYNHQSNHKNPYNDYTNQNNYVYQPSVSDDAITFEDIILNVRRSDHNATEKLNYTRKAGICQNDHGGPLVTWVGAKERLIGVSSVFRLDKSYSCVGPYLFTSTEDNGGFLNCVVNGNVDKEDKPPNIPDKPDDGGKNPDKPNEKPDRPNEEPHKPNEEPHKPNEEPHKPNEEPHKPNEQPKDKPSDGGGQDVPKDPTKPDPCDAPPEKKGYDLTMRRISWRHHPDGPAANELPFDLFVRPVRPIG